MLSNGEEREVDRGDYRQGRRDWAKNGKLDITKVSSQEYRKGAQDERIEQVDAELRRLDQGKS